MLKTREITTLGLFLALGLILPYVTSHAFGIPGTVLLPMHLPVIIIGFLYGPMIGFILGLIIPTLSFLLTGMPSVLMLPIMLVELSLYGFTCGLMYKKLKLNIYFSLVIAMVVGRLGYLSILYLLTNVLGIAAFGKIASVVTAITVGIPGIIIQLVFIPLMVKFLKGHIYVEENIQFNKK